MAGLDLARPLIEEVLAGSPKAFLLLVLDSGEPIGFAAVEPPPGGEGEAELRYLGVAPNRWGGGAARALLAALPERLELGGFRRARLWVYADNRRATGLYAAYGWRADGAPVPHPRTGKLEQRYQLDLAV